MSLAGLLISSLPSFSPLLQRYHDLREVLLTMEKYILKELGFGFYNIMDHPHKFILYYIKTLGGESSLAQKAWNYLNDSLRLDCCVRYRAELIACAAIFMAARDLQVTEESLHHAWLCAFSCVWRLTFTQCTLCSSIPIYR